ncbi:hypothetical protein JOB18_032963 [Solea senegalensis]|uniref:Uncharacterized protein n=1 Tax=Solea senegalensis TaxID=28829 RepID=A0AAV6QW93_SOLSE|nr:hypothetical protein JOB18_032963 [Solea senegalensis]
MNAHRYTFARGGAPRCVCVCVSELERIRARDNRHEEKHVTEAFGAHETFQPVPALAVKTEDEVSLHNKDISAGSKRLTDTRAHTHRHTLQSR